MKAKLKVNGKEIVIEGIAKADGIKKYTGLMFRKNSPALFFDFSRKKEAIHSFFCFPFIAIWLHNGKIAEYGIIKPWQARVIPDVEFDTLIEVPLNRKYIHLLQYFSHEGL
jgi:uncharacterized membrane protein (UPF0127 family)